MFLLGLVLPALRASFVVCVGSAEGRIFKAVLVWIGEQKHAVVPHAAKVPRSRLRCPIGCSTCTSVDNQTLDANIPCCRALQVLFTPGVLLDAIARHTQMLVEIAYKQAVKVRGCTLKMRRKVLADAELDGHHLWANDLRLREPHFPSQRLCQVQGL